MQSGDLNVPIKYDIKLTLYVCVKDLHSYQKSGSLEMK